GKQPAGKGGRGGGGVCRYSCVTRAFSPTTFGGLRGIFLFSQSLGEGASVFSFCLFVDFSSLHRKRDGVPVECRAPYASNSATIRVSRCCHVVTVWMTASLSSFFGKKCWMNLANSRSATRSSSRSSLVRKSCTSLP